MLLKKLPALSIRWKMTLLYTALLTLLMVLFSLFLFFSIERLMTNSLTQTLEVRFKQAQDSSSQIAKELASLNSTSSETNQKPSQLSSLEQLAGPGLFWQIRDIQGQIMATSANLNGQLLPTPANKPARTDQIQNEQIRLPIANLLPEVATTDIKEARFQMFSSQLVDASGQELGILQAAQSLLALDEVQDGMVDVLEQGIAVALVVAIVAGLWLAGRLLRPIARITATAQQIGSSQDLSQRLALTWVKPKQDEVGKLTITFNTMLERLEAAFKTRQQFVADASHELKTPLTAILGHANLLRRRGKANPVLLEETTAAIIHQAERLHRLTLSLLELAQADEKRVLVRQELSLIELVSEVVKEVTPLAQTKAIQLSFTSPQEIPLLVAGDRDKLKQVVLNLIDNALKFTPPGGQVRVNTSQELKDQKEVILLEVEDSGCGIATTHLPHIFERFYRAEISRSRGSGGSGLGLAIVQEVVRQHGGEIEVQSQTGQGSVFRVYLPPLNRGEIIELEHSKLVL